MAKGKTGCMLKPEALLALEAQQSGIAALRPKIHLLDSFVILPSATIAGLKSIWGVSLGGLVVICIDVRRIMVDVHSRTPGLNICRARD